MNARCPGCLRERIARHPAGLVFDHALACPLLAAEDATHAADVERLAEQRGHGRARLTRPTTEAERTLLAACGHVLPDDSSTTVEPITRGVLRRTWDGADLDATASSDAV